MPLSSPAPRQRHRQRRIECQGYLRDDGLWEVEGFLTDVKDFETLDNPYAPSVPAGHPIHHMAVRIAFDTEMVIQAVEVAIDHHPYPVCPAVRPNFQRLVGENIARGFTKRLHALLGREQGCTHTLWLIQCCATVAVQTLAAALGAGPERVGRPSLFGRIDANGRPPLLNTCHAFLPSSEVVLRLMPELYVRPPEDNDTPET